MRYINLRLTYLLTISLTCSKIPDISLTAVKFPDISWFSRQVVTLSLMMLRCHHSHMPETNKTIDYTRVSLKPIFRNLGLNMSAAAAAD